MIDLIIIGGGAAGLMAAAKAAASGRSVLLLEKGDRCGRKLLITGKGRCNITNSREWDEFKDHVHPDANFFKNAFFSFSNRDVVDFLNRAGLPTKEERGMRVYPVSDRSKDVRDTFLSYIARFPNVKIRYSVEVTGIRKTDGGFFEVDLLTCHFQIETSTVSARSVIIATGGLSYPVTGSTGDGYRFAEQFGHRIVPTQPSLTALVPYRYDRLLEGLTLRNVMLTLLVNGNPEQSEFGEITFTSGGLEGALGFRVSRKAVRALNNGDKVELSVDLKPSLTTEQLKRRVETSPIQGSPVKKYLESFLPIQAILPFMTMSEQVTVQNIPVRLKNWKMKVVDYVSYERCVVTAGGVDLREISRKTLESKRVPGLFFAGEVMDLDADTGGYNLQIAFSTGALAAASAVKYTESPSIG